MSDLAWFYSAPPVTRTLVAATFLESILCHGGLVSFYQVVFLQPAIFQLLPQVWRFVTPFLLTGGGISFIFDLYFLWTYGSDLELNSPRFTQPGDFFTYLIFVCTVILAIAGFFLSAPIFTSALILALAYSYSLSNRGKRVTFIIIQIPVVYLPWAMLTFTLVMGGWYQACQQGTGIIGAHAYEFLTNIYPTFQGGRNWVATPAFIKRAFGADRSAFNHKKYGTSFRPGDKDIDHSGAGMGWSSALSGVWGGRGAGRRLGGD